MKASELEELIMVLAKLLDPTLLAIDSISPNSRTRAATKRAFKTSVLPSLTPIDR
jgi:hypothetical protein